MVSYQRHRIGVIRATGEEGKPAPFGPVQDQGPGQGPDQGPGQGESGRPVPIIESRVTSAASASSPMPSVPSGRAGSTM